MQALVVLVGGLLVGGCGTAAPSAGPVTLRLGYFPNVTHAAAVVGVAKDSFAEALGSGVTLEPKTFNAGPDAVEGYDALARAGFRRSHRVAYRPSCVGCASCVPVRIAAGAFQPSVTLAAFVSCASAGLVTLTCPIDVSTTKPRAVETAPMFPRSSIARTRQ